MQRNYYIYEKPELKIIINKLPVWFTEISYDGDEKEGNISFKSANDYDEIYGNNAKIEVEFSTIERIKFYHAKEVQKSIDVYNAINVVVTNKERVWLNTHEFTYWFGTRTKMIRKRYYPENHIHGLFYCELTERLFEIHSKIIRKHYEGFKPYLLEAYNSFLCHE
jgi:hypothetical protein